MTPQTAALTIHEQDALGMSFTGSVALAETGTVVPLSTRRSRPPQRGERSLPWLMRREARHRRLLGAADVLAGALALTLALDAGDGRVLAFAALPLVVVLFKIAGLYDRDQIRLVHSTIDELPALLQVTGLFTLGVTILGPLLDGWSLPAGDIAALWLLSFLATVGARIAARWAAGRISGAERCLVIGDPRLTDRIRGKIASSSARASVIATLPVTCFDGEPLGSGPDDVRALADELRLDRIIIAPATTDAEGVGELIRIAKAAGVRVSVLPRMLEVVGSSVEFDDVDGLTMLAVRPFGLPRSSRVLKRAFDLVATALGVMAVSPILLAIALAIRLDSRGPILFRQIRVGRDGRHFHIFKFRSMVIDAEEQKDRLRALNEVGESDGGMFKLSNDPRVTRVGNLLRKTSLDEMPQLLNVLRGEMSLVGPRPLVTEEDEQVLGLDRSRLHLTPGMTGPWQVLGSRVPMREMVGIDYLYVANWSLWQDVKLLLHTVRHVARRGNV
jgi:exopolysaccharide biosynthesis polyprenyl glycosylphosphotransferase